MFSALPPLTRGLIVANVAVFFIGALLGQGLIGWFGLWPLATAEYADFPAFLPWQLVTYSFLHGSLGHLAFNMFALYMFGCELEHTLGSRRMFSLYFASVVTAALVQLMMQLGHGGPPQPTVGASGGVFGLLLAFGLFFPRRTIVLLIPPVPMPAWLFVTLYGAIELVLGVFGSASGVAHFAHLGGMLGAGLLIRRWLRRR